MPTRSIPEIAQDMANLLERQLKLMKSSGRFNERIKLDEYQTLQERLNQLKDELQEACTSDRSC